MRLARAARTPPRPTDRSLADGAPAERTPADGTLAERTPADGTLAERTPADPAGASDPTLAIGRALTWWPVAASPHRYARREDCCVYWPVPSRRTDPAAAGA